MENKFRIKIKIEHFILLRIHCNKKYLERSRFLILFLRVFLYRALYNICDIFLERFLVLYFLTTARISSLPYRGQLQIIFLLRMLYALIEHCPSISYDGISIILATRYFFFILLNLENCTVNLNVDEVEDEVCVILCIEVCSSQGKERCDFS